MFSLNIESRTVLAGLLSDNVFFNSTVRNIKLCIKHIKLSHAEWKHFVKYQLNYWP